MKRGDIYYADLSPVVGSEQGGVRPVLIVQNDVGNRYSPTVIAAAITSQKEKSKLPTHIELDSKNCGLSKDSVVLLEQIRTIDKRRLREKNGQPGCKFHVPGKPRPVHQLWSRTKPLSCHNAKNKAFGPQQTEGSFYRIPCYYFISSTDLLTVCTIGVHCTFLNNATIEIGM